MRIIMITGAVLLVGLTAMAQPREGAGRDTREGVGKDVREHTRTREDGRRPGPPAMRRDRPAAPPRDEADETALLLRLLRNPAFAERLKLSTEDQQQLEQEALAIQHEIAALQTEMHQLALRQARLMAAPEPDEAAVLEAVEAIGRVRTDIAKLRMRQLLAIRRRLSPDQLQQMRRFMYQQRQQERRGRDL